MGKHDVSRRQLLAGLAGAGGLGAAVGTGTASIFSDEALFGGSSFSTGALDLAVRWETDDDSGTDRGSVSVPIEVSKRDPMGSVDLSVSLPTLDGSNNPARVWMRAGCPDDEKLLDDLEVTIRYADCSKDCVVASGSLAELAGGVPLEPRTGDGTDRCLQPSESIELEMDVGLTNFERHGSADFSLEFVGVQCRNSGGVDPFPAATDCRPSKHPGRPAISFVAFCTTDDEPIRPSLPTMDLDGDGPEVTFWRTAADVDYVVVKGAGTMTIYDYRDHHRFAGSAWVGDPDAAVPSYQVQPGESATPCEVAVRETDGGDASSLRSIKVEYEGGRWEVENG